jgi:hypothetical protein
VGPDFRGSLFDGQAGLYYNTAPKFDSAVEGATGALIEETSGRAAQVFGHGDMLGSVEMLGDSTDAPES